MAEKSIYLYFLYIHPYARLQLNVEAVMFLCLTRSHRTK